MATNSVSPTSSAAEPGMNPQSSYWQLLNGVARDLDLMLQDLRPEYEEGPVVGGDDGCTDDFAALERSLTSALLLEQFVRGVGDDVEASAGTPTGIYRSSPFSKSLNGKGFDDAVADEFNGREDLSHSPSTPPSPAPPAPSHLSFHSTQLHNDDIDSPPAVPPLPDGGSGSATDDGGGDGGICSQSTLCSDTSSDARFDVTDGASATSSEQAAPCDIGVLERLIRTHHIWFLPGIGRAGAVHLLQGKEVGNFIVRQSSKQNTMALSVRLPEQLGPYIEHYLIETVDDGKLRLEGSDNHFDAIPMLVAHYCQCCDELPVTLTLPRSLAQAAYRQELSSLALLGQDFWVSSLIQSPSGGSFSDQTPVKFDSQVPQPCSPSIPVPASLPHSTFKPPLPDQPKPSPSPGSNLPPPVLPINNEILSFTNVSPGISPQSPPSSAPKLPPRSVPPPPPPRTLPLTTRPLLGGQNGSSGTAPIASLISTCNTNSVPPTELSNGNVDKINSAETLSEISSPSNEPNNTSRSPLHPTTNGVACYKQSSVIDSPVLCYHSSLADKISDYEDIWATPSRPESRTKSELSPFSSQWHARNANDNRHQMSAVRQLNALCLTPKSSSNFSCQKELISQETQTDCSQDLLQFDVDIPTKFINQVVSPALTADSGIGAHTDDGITENDRTESGTLEKQKWPVGQFSSPFYAEPVDSLALGVPQANPFHGEGSPQHRPSNLVHSMRFASHRHSDPSLQWACNDTDLSQDDISLDDRTPSLFSSLDNLPQVACPQQPTMGIDVALQARLSTASEFTSKKDSSTQVSCPDISVVTAKQDRAPPRHLQRINKKDSKPRKQHRSKRDPSWKVDSSWEWMGNTDSSEDEEEEDNKRSNDSGGFSSLPAEWKFPVDYTKNHLGGSQYSEIITVEDMILQKAPHLRIPEIKPLTQSNLMRVSEYDNVGYRPPPKRADPQQNDATDDTATEFSEPWDSLRWDRLLRLVIPENEAAATTDNSLMKGKDETPKALVVNGDKAKMQQNGGSFVPLEPSESASMLSITSEVTSTDDMNDSTSISDFHVLSYDRDRSKSFQERLEPYLTKQRIMALRNREATSVGENIRQYIFRLSQEGNNTFAKAIENFIQCTKDGNETNPAVVMRNIRQFMTGMKNYLLKHGEGHFDQLVQQERSRLRSDEFLNIDAIIEGALHKLVIKPLKNFLYQLFVNEYSKNDSLKLLSDSIRHAREKSPEEMGIRPEFQPPHGAAMEVVRHFLLRLQQAYSPLKKLENLLAAISTIYNSVQDDKKTHGKEHASLGADDFLPIFIYVLVHCGMIAAEIEADYMWGLLHPSLLSGEGGYYLTTLSSAVHVLKSFSTPTAQDTDLQRHRTNSFHNNADAADESHRLTGPPQSPDPRLPSIADLQGFMKIMIPDEITGNIISKTLPVRPNMTTKEVCKMIAHKFKVTNPQDYGLFKLTKGEETQLQDGDCPQTIKADLVTSGVECMFAYKRCDARFVWPVLDKK